MFRYAQWLDGAFYEVLNGKPGSLTPQQFSQTVGLLKLHALFGTDIVLSDVQLIDSHILLRLFADESFREFLNAHPSFLQYVAYPEKENKRDRYDLLIRGLQRLVRPGNYPSAFGDSEPALEFAKSILEIGKIDPNMQLTDRRSAVYQVIEKWPQYAEFLEGMLRGIGHFCNTDTSVRPSNLQREPFDLYEMILLALENPKIPGPKRRILTLTKNFIDSSIENRFDRGRQAIIFKMLDQRYKQNPDYLSIKQTTHHAWNAAIEHTLGAEGGLLSSLSPKSVQVAEFVDNPTDSLTPLTLRDRQLLVPRISSQIPRFFLGRDPASLGWLELASIVRDTESTAKDFQEALRSSSKSQIQKAMERHISKLAAAMTEYPGRPSHHAYLWTVGSAVALVIGLTTSSWETGIAAGHVVTLPTESFLGAVYLLRRFVTKNTLTKTVQQVFSSREH